VRLQSTDLSGALKSDRSLYIDYLESQLDDASKTRAAVRSNEAQLQAVQARLKALEGSTINVAKLFRSHQAIVQSSEDSMLDQLKQMQHQLKLVHEVLFGEACRVCKPATCPGIEAVEPGERPRGMLTLQFFCPCALLMVVSVQSDEPLGHGHLSSTCRGFLLDAFHLWSCTQHCKLADTIQQQQSTIRAHTEQALADMRESSRHQLQQVQHVRQALTDKMEQLEFSCSKRESEDRACNTHAKSQADETINQKIRSCQAAFCLYQLIHVLLSLPLHLGEHET
jgi:hypothetical protein